MRACPACHNKKTEEYYSITDLPLLLFPVDYAVKSQIKSDNITSFKCAECYHVFTDPLEDRYSKLIYEEYYRYYPFENLESMGAAYRKPFEKFFEDTLLKSNKFNDKKLLEVGCSSGKALEFFERFGLKCNGIDPSPLNVGSDPKIISGFYQKHQLTETFDIIVSRFVLEHINDLDSFLAKIKTDLNKGGLVFLQVPNILQFINGFIPSFLAHEHTHYFNPYSLIKLAQRLDFEVISIHFHDSQSLCIALQFGSQSHPIKSINNDNYENCYSSFIKQRENVGTELKELIKSLSDVCYYGSGLILTWILYDLHAVSSGKKNSLVDDNPNIIDKYLPCADLKVEMYSKEHIQGYQNVILTLNPYYHKIVIDKIRNDGFKGIIYAITNNGIVKI